MSTYPPYIDLGPLSRAAGTVRLPGSKSISNRTLLLAASGRGRNRHPRPAVVGRCGPHAGGAGATRRRARSKRHGAGTRNRLRRSVPQPGSGPVSGQRRHRVPPAHRGVGTERRPLQVVGRAAHARASDRRSGGCAARARRGHPLPRQRGLPAAGDFPGAGPRCRPRRRARRGVEPVLDRPAHGPADDGRAI